MLSRNLEIFLYHGIKTSRLVENSGDMCSSIPVDGRYCLSQPIARWVLAHIILRSLAVLTTPTTYLDQFLLTETDHHNGYPCFSRSNYHCRVWCPSGEFIHAICRAKTERFARSIVKRSSGLRIQRVSSWRKSRTGKTIILLILYSALYRNSCRLIKYCLEVQFSILVGLVTR